MTPSDRLLRLTAEITPAGMPSTTAMARAATASSRVAGTRSITTRMAGSL